MLIDYMAKSTPPAPHGKMQPEALWDADYPLHFQVANRIRERIISKEFAPATRLPGRRELHELLDVCQATIQEAMDVLAAEGYIHVKARKLGTYVVEQPPHLFQYKLLFPSAGNTKNHYFRALKNAAEKISAESKKKISFFLGVTHHSDIAKYQELKEQVLQQKLTGLIFFLQPKTFEGSEIFDTPGLPRVAICSPYENNPYPKLYFDYGDFFRKAVHHLHKKGCRRIALATPDWWSERPDEFSQYIIAMKESGQEISDYRQLYLPLWKPEAIRVIVFLGMNTPADHRPDGLIVADEHLLPGVESGLRSAGIRVPEDLQIVTHQTEPSPNNPGFPMTTISFCAETILRSAIDSIDSLRAGETIPDRSFIPASAPQDP